MPSIYLSPSTQENNIGFGSYGTEEARMNELTNLIEPLLGRNNYILFRNRPDMTLKQVVNDSNSKNPDIHVAIHSNAFNTAARGAEVFCHRFGGNGERLARSIYGELEKITPTPDRGVKEGANFYGDGKPLYETAYTRAPAVIIEVAFHDNPQDAQWILDNMQPIAEAIVRGINIYFGKADFDAEIEYYKGIIQSKCRFDYPQGVWAVIDQHPYPRSLYKKWAESYLQL